MRVKARQLVPLILLSTGLAVPAAVGAANTLDARMTGSQIVNPRGGAPHGVAEAHLRIDSERSRLCFEIAYEQLGGKATAGFVRTGGRRETARPGVVLFAGRAPNPVSGCVDEVRPGFLAALRERPAGHYVDLATREFPKGAVRGQLHAAAPNEESGGMDTNAEASSGGAVSGPPAR